MSTATPLFSIVIGVYNDWASLGLCLHSIAQQKDGPSFDVVVVDDGSREPAPESICQWGSRFPLRIVRQSHTGISAARNRGVKLSRGSVLLFVDADCRLLENCLSALASTIADSPEHDCFQLRLRGDCSGPVGRAEELRLMVLQNHLLQPNGCIRYLNAAGFAIRRTRADVKEGLFDPEAIRGEDTLLLAHLIEAEDLPLFVADAFVQHVIPLSLMECLRKDIRSAYLEGSTYDVIASSGVTVRMSHRERWNMLASAWKASGTRSTGTSAWFVLVARQGLQRTVSVAYQCLRFTCKRAGLPAPSCERQANAGQAG